MVNNFDNFFVTTMAAGTLICLITLFFGMIKCYDHEYIPQCFNENFYTPYYLLGLYVIVRS
jgi:hypothetical protein